MKSSIKKNIFIILILFLNSFIEGYVIRKTEQNKVPPENQPEGPPPLPSGPPRLECYNLNKKLPYSGDEVIYDNDYMGELSFNKDGTLKYILNDYETKSHIINRHEYRIGNPQKIPNPPYTLDINGEGKLIIKNKDKNVIWEYSKTVKGEAPYYISVSGRLLIKDKNKNIVFDGRDYFDKKYNDVPLDIKSKLFSRIKTYMNSYSEPEANLDILPTIHTNVEETKFVYTDEEKIKFIPVDDESAIQEIEKHFIEKDGNIRFIEKKNYNMYETDCTTGQNKEKICLSYHILNRHAIISSYYENGKLYYYGIYIKINADVKKKNFQEEIKSAILYKSYLSLNRVFLEAQDRLNKKIKLKEQNKEEDRKLSIYENLKDMLDEVRASNEEKRNERLRRSCAEIRLLSNIIPQPPSRPTPIPTIAPPPVPGRYLPSTGKPKKYTINSMTRETSITYDTFNIDKVEEILEKYKFPDLIKDQIELVCYSAYNYDKKDLHFVIDTDIGEYEGILGIVIRDGKTVFLVFGKSKIKASLTPNKEVDWNSPTHCNMERAPKTGYCPASTSDRAVGPEESQNPLFPNDPYKYCKACNYQEVGYTDEDKDEMKEIFENFGIEEILIKLDLMDSTQTLLNQHISIVSNNKNFVAKIGKDGKIYVGSNHRLSQLFKAPLYTVGTPQASKFKPYKLLISENGQLYILNNDNERVWKAKMITYSGISPYSLKLSDSGDLLVIDSNGQTVSNLRVNNK